jgi:CDP-diglyceride synthetase
VLKQRVITGLALAIGFALVLALGSFEVFAFAVGTVMALAAWEWSDLAGLSSRWSRLVFTLVTALIGALVPFAIDLPEFSRFLQPILIAACVWWGVALLWVQGFPASSIIWGSVPVRLLMGWFILLPAWVSCLYLRALPDGIWLVLMVVNLVAAADVGAYFTGRAIGRTKLAARVSPGKTWEGVLGGLVLTLAVASVYNYFVFQSDWLQLCAFVAPVALVSVLGDLLESMVKRHRGVKDSGHLLPGHGGFMDRIDGLVAALPVFALGVFSTQWVLQALN